MTDRNVVDFENDCTNVVNSAKTFIGIQFITDRPVTAFWQITCPCGVTQDYALNELPETDTRMPCDNPDHWAIKFDLPDDGIEQ